MSGKMTEADFKKELLTREALEALVLREAEGEWGCEDITGVTIERCDPARFGRNWKVTRLQNEDLPAGVRTVQRIVEHLGLQYDLKAE